MFDFRTFVSYNNQRDAEVAEWQTRRSQKPLRATSCGFDSHLRHQPPFGRRMSMMSGRGSAW